MLECPRCGDDMEPDEDRNWQCTNCDYGHGNIPENYDEQRYNINDDEHEEEN